LVLLQLPAGLRRQQVAGTGVVLGRDGGFEGGSRRSRGVLPCRRGTAPSRPEYHHGRRKQPAPEALLWSVP
ncbi:hypothetical protein ACWGAN_37140, partial [Streptomyces sp. NPDC054945]